LAALTLENPNTDFNPRMILKNRNDSNMLTINLSSTLLSDNDISVLEKGLSFIPTPRTLPIKSIIENKDRLIRNIKIKSFFQNSTKTFDPKLKTFQEKSTWTPETSSLSKDILETIKELDDVTMDLIKRSKKNRT